MAKAQHATRYRSLPPFLRKLREQAKLTQRELAAKLRVSQVAVHTSGRLSATAGVPPMTSLQQALGTLKRLRWVRSLAVPAVSARNWI